MISFLTVSVSCLRAPASLLWIDSPLIACAETDFEMYKGSMPWSFSAKEEDEDDDRGAEDGKEGIQGR